MIRRAIKDLPRNHHRISRTYANYSEKRERTIVKTRKDAVVLAQIRSGHSCHLNAYANLMDPAKDPMCNLCQETIQTVEHWLECAGTMAARMEIFGSIDTPLETQCDNHQALICTDSQSLCSALQNELADNGTIMQLLRTNRGRATKPWISGHADILGNELTDQHAKEAADD